MKLIFKIRLLLKALCCFILVGSILIACTAISHSKELGSHYQSTVEQEIYRNIYIYDSNGIAIYSGGFSDNESLRASTFHIVGDRNGSVTTSILAKTQYELQNADKSVFTGFKPEKRVFDLTIDSDLQINCYDILNGLGYNGSIVISDYKTGEIKAMVSTPSVDVYNTDCIRDGAFLNKAAMCYPPGSVFKAVAAAAVIESDNSAKRALYNCYGKYGYVKCIYGRQHGNQTFKTVLSNSCNCGVAAIASRYLTLEEFNSFIDKKQIMSSDVVAGYDIASGNLSEDLLWGANGQSTVLISPLQIANFYNAIANDGVAEKLYFDKSYDSDESNRIMSEATADYIAEALKEVTKARGISVNSFGKTGTAEYDGDEISSAWFACSLVDDALPSYTIVVFLEHAGSSDLAVEVAKEIIETQVLGG